VAANIRATERPSIASMAWTSPFSRAINDATTILVADRVTVVTASGNYAQDAQHFSPASADAVIVVGASDITNAMWPSSNFGEVVDVFAPGVDITAASNTGPSNTVTADGTSAACAHVAGIAAYLLSQDATLTPGPMFNKILSLATPNAISGVPAGTTTAFVYNGVAP
jgi:cerevisin